MRLVRICLAVCFPLLRLCAVEESAFVPEIRLRVQTFAQETLPVVNPIRWAIFLERVAEGTQVEKGDLLFRIDLAGPASRQKSAENNLKEARNRSEQQIGAIEDQITALEDTRAERVDARGVLEARRVWLTSLPLAEDVQISEGRLEVARRNLAAAREEADTAQKRLERGLISPAALESALHDLHLQEARTQYAEKRLQTESQPAHPDDLRILDLRMLNLDREIKKLDGEILSKQEMLRIESTARARITEALEREMGEAEEELQHGEVRSPATGVVLYTSSLKREIASGSQPTKGINLAEIPVTESLALRGSLPEHFRSLFQVGDPVRIRLNQSPEQEISGKLSSISPFSKDAVEGGGAQSSGVKWVEVIFTLDALPPNIPFGVYGEAVLRAASPQNGPGVPLDWVRHRDGKAHIAVNRRFQEVEGNIVGPHFVLEAPFPPLEAMGPEGEWRISGENPTALETDRFTASGELTPLESVEVKTPSLRSWDLKVAWLHPENQWVEKGAKIVELESEHLRNRLRETTRDAEASKEERESAAEELIVRKRETAFRIEVAETQLEIRRLEKALTETAVNVSSLHQAVLDVSTQHLQLEAARTDLARAEATPELTAPAEIRRRQRDLRRRELQSERAELQLTIAQRGADPVDKSLASLEVVRQEASLAEIRADAYRSLSGAESRLRYRIRRERNRTERNNRSIQDIASTVITAPSDGLLKYELVWDGVGQSKIRSGLGVWSGTRLLGLSDSRRLMVKVSVPERHVRKLEEGMRVQVRIPSEGNRNWVGRVETLNLLLDPGESPSLRASPYANREPPHEQVLSVDILVEESPSAPLKPGAIAHVVFPFAK